MREPYAVMYEGAFHARTVGLADVLLAMENAGVSLRINQLGRIDQRSITKWLGAWNLRADDLEKQSKETIRFLYELLK